MHHPSQTFCTFFDGFLHHRLRLLHSTQFHRRVSHRSVALAASCSSASIFQMSSTLEWQDKRMWNPFKMLRTEDWQKLKSSRLCIFILVIQDHIESIGKANTIKRG